MTGAVLARDLGDRARDRPRRRLRLADDVDRVRPLAVDAGEDQIAQRAHAIAPAPRLVDARVEPGELLAREVKARRRRELEREVGVRREECRERRLLRVANGDAAARATSTATPICRSNACSKISGPRSAGPR